MSLKWQNVHIIELNLCNFRKSPNATFAICAIQLTFCIYAVSKLATPIDHGCNIKQIISNPQFLNASKLKKKKFQELQKLPYTWKAKFNFQFFSFLFVLPMTTNTTRPTRTLSLMKSVCFAFPMISL